MKYSHKVRIKYVDFDDVKLAFHQYSFISFLTRFQPVKILSWDGIESGKKAKFKFWFFGWKNLTVCHEKYINTNSKLSFYDKGVALPMGIKFWNHFHSVSQSGDEVYIEDLFVPDDCLLGHTEGTYPVILESLTENRVGVSASVLGVAKGAYEEALYYARDRIVADKPILEYQAVAHRQADMVSDIEAAHWMVYHGAWQVDQGGIDHESAAKIKLFVSEAAFRVTERAIRVLGGAGMMREYGVGRHHRDAMVYLFGEGTSDIQRNLISRAMKERDILS